MLDPGDRALYTEALAPPEGARFDFGVATTFSLDLGVLLGVPLHLALASTEDSAELMRDPVILYETLQRVVGRLRIYTQVGRMHAPTGDHLLFGLLEQCVLEVAAPRGGAFHPKIWVLRFADGDGTYSYRLLVLSRNITADVSWDVALALEGRLSATPSPNGALISLIEALPVLAGGASDAAVSELAGEIRNVEWVLPEGCESIDFHVLGLSDAQWRPPPSEQLWVFSPFVTDSALRALAETTKRPVALVSRSESFSELAEPVPFQQALVLHEAAESEDGEALDNGVREIGLHAKVYIARTGRDLTVCVGSANATTAALIAHHNVEFMAELRASVGAFGNPNWLLDPERKDGLGQMLMPWLGGPEAGIAPETRHNEELLEAARRSIATAGLSLRCRAVDALWETVLAPPSVLSLQGINEIRAWPVTLRRERAVNAVSLLTGSEVVLPAQTLASLTGLTAFELGIDGQRLAFTLNLPLADVPDDRERAILRHVISSQANFLRYLLLLLAGIGDGAEAASVARAFNTAEFMKFHSGDEDLPLLEEMTRAFCRDPARLKRVKRLVEELCTDADGRQVLPKGFLALWESFETALAGRFQ